MWHAEALDQELDKIVRKIVLCQKIVRGFICRKRFARLLETKRKQNQERIQFINNLHRQGSIAADNLDCLNFRIKVN
jgi:hypothetical protein